MRYTNMTATVTPEEAQSQLRELIEQLVPGEDLVIMENQRPVARLVAAAKPTQRRFGTMQGSVQYMAPDFDAPLEDFQDYILPFYRACR